MPFTPAHAAVAVPFKEKSPSLFMGLVLGSMAPDFEYFIHLEPFSKHGHTFWGMFYYNLPITLALWLCVLFFIGPSILKNIPSFGKFKLKELVKLEDRLTPVNLLIFCVFSLIGMLTHVFWDAFTHDGGYFVSRVPFLTHQMNIFFLQIPVYKICQHGSTLLGLIMLLLLMRNGEQHKPLNMKYILSIVGISSVLYAIVILFRGYSGIGALIVSAMSCVFIALLLVGIIERAMDNRRT